MVKENVVFFSDESKPCHKSNPSRISYRYLQPYMGKNVYILPYLGTGTRKICHGITL